jgi:formylglycine-generating enzyme required for sulfatase activity
MFDISDKVRIMKGEVTIGLFRQVMEGYEIKGHNADELRAILTDPAQESKPLTYVSLLDAREFAARLSNLTGRKFRVQTEDEWLAARDKLTGKNWTWTETKYSDSSFVLRHLSNDDRDIDHPEDRYDCNAVRLVEDFTA